MCAGRDEQRRNRQCLRCPPDTYAHPSIHPSIHPPTTNLRSRRDRDRDGSPREAKSQARQGTTKLGGRRSPPSIHNGRRGLQHTQTHRPARHIHACLSPRPTTTNPHRPKTTPSDASEAKRMNACMHAQTARLGWARLSSARPAWPSGGRPPGGPCPRSWPGSPRTPCTPPPTPNDGGMGVVEGRVGDEPGGCWSGCSAHRWHTHTHT